MTRYATEATCDWMPENAIMLVYPGEYVNVIAPDGKERQVELRAPQVQLITNLEHKGTP